jgi:hypothetical protein
LFPSYELEALVTRYGPTDTYGGLDETNEKLLMDWAAEAYLASTGGQPVAEPPAPEPAPEGPVVAVVTWHVNDHAEGKTFTDTEEAKTYFQTKAWPGGANWAAR